MTEIWSKELGWPSIVIGTLARPRDVTVTYKGLVPRC
jgi:hypothetical protein